jgi:hypothetical protein
MGYYSILKRKKILTMDFKDIMVNETSQLQEYIISLVEGT